MENDINEYKYLFNNEEKRTTIIKEFEQNLSVYIQETERIWEETKTIEKSSTKFNEYSQNVLQQLQKLNDELRKMSELKSENFKKDVNFLLNLEKENYKMTLTIYMNKLKCFELLKNDATLISLGTTTFSAFNRFNTLIQMLSSMQMIHSI